jgi:hypothetical protein
MSKKTNAALNEVVDENEDLSTILDFSEDIADAEAPDPLPEREYKALITKSESRLSAKGRRMAAVTFTIPPEEYPADYPLENAPEGKQVTHYIMADDNPQDRYRMKKFCETIGAPMARSLNVGSWLGLEASIQIKHEEYEGVKRERVAKVDRA